MRFTFFTFISFHFLFSVIDSLRFSRFSVYSTSYTFLIKVRKTKSFKFYLSVINKSQILLVRPGFD